MYLERFLAERKRPDTLYDDERLKRVRRQPARPGFCVH
jgi:hypothetical protein